MCWARARPRVLTPFKRRTWFPCGVFFVLVAISSGCGPAVAPRPAPPNVLTIGVPLGVIAGTDLGLQNLANTLTNEGLTQLSGDGHAIPKLAESWAWENEGRRLRLLLRPGVTFHDGTPLTATLAAKLVTDAVRRPANQRLFTALGDITSVRAEGERAVVFDLSRQSAFLPEDLELPLTLGAEREGTGAYRVLKRESSEIVLERFEAYYGGVPNIERVDIKASGTMRAAWASLLRGEVDLVTDVPPDAVQFIQNDEVEVISYSRRYQYLVAFNSRRAPFNSPVVRRALNYAIDRQRLVQTVLQTHGIASTSPIWPKHWAYDNSVTPYAYDSALARSLLESAGMQPQQHEGRPDSRLRFNCMIPANFPVLERVGLEVQKQLYSIGVDMQFDVVSPEEFNLRVSKGDFEALLIDMVSGPSIGRAYNFWGSTRNVKGFNVFGYENPEAERLFTVLRTSYNEAAVRSATSNLQRVLLDDPPALFLAWNERSRAVRREFQVIPEPDRDPLFTIWRWSPAGGRLASTQ